MSEANDRAVDDEAPRQDRSEQPEALPTDLEERPLAQHPAPFVREHLEAEERRLKDSILRMGSMVAEQVIAAIDAMERHDVDAATAVIVADERLNEAQREITNDVSTTIATQQPVARDLRFLLTLEHVAYDLERMGDHAGSVAKQARKLAPHAPLADYVHLPEMGRLVAQQVRDVLAAVVDVDEVWAREVAKRDDDVDELYHRIFAETLDLMRADPDNVDRGA
ncbi:MAG: phosphate signaling complex protein PhoU, partial [Chloroflexota bacterium]